MPLTRRFSTTISKNPARQQKAGRRETGNGKARRKMVGRLTGYLRGIASQTTTRDNFRPLDSLSRLFSSFPSLPFSIAAHPRLGCSPPERLFSSRWTGETRKAYRDVQGESGGINIELCLCSIRLILNGALWAFRGIDRPQSGNHTESETRSRDFPWVPSPTNDPAAATTMAGPPSWIMPCLLRHYKMPADIIDKLYTAVSRMNVTKRKDKNTKRTVLLKYLTIQLDTELKIILFGP
ncbi:hypothetical protein G5I_04900 [Acromyrmex echinatior]|uniref:Uncharacterized protein n=1 Tax=Acromyrmex echinatior TaxID=103372 RepID=F4WGU9_ACREC|nr:hypothetical protein G5I_04900 [Acromyrmex echinatior]